MRRYQISSGRAYPLGATLTDTGCNFALFSAHGEKVELCIFDPRGEHEVQRIVLPEFSDDIYHGHVEGLCAGTLYGYRVYGPYAPHDGHRFNPAKLLLDPYAKQLHGELSNNALHYGYDQQSSQQDLTQDHRDNAHLMPKCVVSAALAPSESHQQIRQRDTIIYELHVKGFTAQHPDVPIELRGTFAGLANDKVCQYLQRLGITSIELMPVHQFLNEAFVEEKALSNYWGYNTVSFFVPHGQYCHSGQPEEFQAMVAKFHQYGIEVLLDVVYNHSAEGNELGPTFSFKGIDNASYYRLQAHDKRYYENYSGCGNTLNIEHPRVLQLVCDSLRYWVQTMGVDGFRFDLAPILGRETPHFNTNNAFFTTLKQDPILAQTKLIAEPWDIGNDGYQLGRFPKNWLEYNDQFRDSCRRYWRGDQGMVPEFARRLHGSSDIFEQPSRRPSASVNFITSHDGFTLQDLVSYQKANNVANGEQNRDGHKSNFSCNFGCEGPSNNDTINRLRARQKRNLLTTLFIAQGTPMLLSGDELGNSQAGNNNAYCQDNATSWLDWQESDNATELSFVKQLIALRKAHPLLNRSHYHHGQQVSAKTGLKDIDWFNCRGEVMQDADWHDVEIKCFAMLLAQTDDDVDVSVNTVADDALLIIFNAHPCEINYALPKLNGYWQQLIDTSVTTSISAESSVTAKTENSIQHKINITRSNINIAAHSCVVLSYFSEVTAKENIESTSIKNTPPIHAIATRHSNKQREN